MKNIGFAIFEHCSYAGTCTVKCEVLERRKWQINDAQIWEKMSEQSIARTINEKSNLNGYVIRYFDPVLDENVTEWVKDLYISKIKYNIS